MNNNENIIMMESNFQDNLAIMNSPSPEVSSHNEACSPNGNVVVLSATVWDRHDTNNTGQVIAKKAPVKRKRSSSAGSVFHSHYLGVPQEGISKRFSDTFLNMD